ncbi:hypothetical protein AB0K18_26505 [Nonomuraea sp. NPDC049421]|uniref:hypothetical protein n=1 Tax=Nonomuraea sp. NPDC049421 TaxID=3155275 RepID=UPI0034482920
MSASQRRREQLKEFLRARREALALPFVLAIEVSGHVRALGPGVEGLRVGQPPPSPPPSRKPQARPSAEP